jgi:hypothetical protein
MRSCTDANGLSTPETIMTPAPIMAMIERLIRSAMISK